MKSFAFGFMLCLVFSSFASADLLESTAAKVTSQPCSDPTRVQHGSGLLFRDEGAVYVLTSEHIVYNGNENICHQVIMAGGKTAKAELVLSDWGYGLALLRLAEKVEAAELPSVDVLLSTTSQPNDKLIAIGFPWESESFRKDSGGSVLTTESSRHFISAVDRMLECKDVHTEYGMSGGAVWNQAGSKVIGILSHQALFLKPGAPSVVRNISKDLPVQATIPFVIPGMTARNWILSALHPSQLETKAALYMGIQRDLEAQLSGREAIVIGNLKFETKDAVKSPGDLIPTGPKNGGGDGAGMGGRISLYESLPIQVSLQNGESTSTAWPRRLEEWQNRVIRRLLSRKTVVVSNLIDRDPTSGLFREVPVSNIAAFFRELLWKQAQPITLVDSQHAQKAIDQGQDLEAVISRFETIKNPLLTQSSLYAKLFLSGQWLTMRTEDFDNALDSRGVFRAEWKTLIDTHFDECVLLMQTLIAMRDTLSELKIAEPK